MAGRFVFPQGYDPHMNGHNALTLARTASERHNAIQKINTSQSISQKVDGSTSSGHSPQLAMSKPVAGNQTKKPAPTSPPRRHFVFTDPVAFRHDAATVVVERHGQLKGYEIYLVEQWACSRVHPTFIITTYTGDANHSVKVGVLGVPTDEDVWSPRLRVYFKAISQFHARPKETPLGMLMVTNLSSFPSALTVIPVPDGDVRKHREDFIVNENLKRLGCSGRSGMSLSTPAGATQAKFVQLYKTSDRIPLYGAVIELVKLCQVALLVFGNLEQEYADGLLCDVTERAINDWWTEIGSEYFNDEPTDGILGPTTVAALLGMLMGARNRLNYYGAPVSKDAFDVFSLKRGIAYFQKSQKMERTRRLDRRTLNRLHQATAKAAAGEGWTVPKAVKSTVAELGGKGGEMVMGMVGRDKGGIGDIETLDIEKYVNLVHGERAKWLWYGKPRRTGTGEGRSDADAGNMTFKKDDHGGYIWSHNRADSMPPEDEVETRRKESPNDVYTSKPPGSVVSMLENGIDRDQQLRRTVLKSVTGKMGDARSGFGRIKDAVGLRGHASKHAKDDDYDARQTGVLGPMGQYFSASSSNLSPVGTPTTGIGKTFTWKNTPEDYKNGALKSKETATTTDPVRESDSLHDESTISLSGGAIEREAAQKDIRAAARWAEQVKDIRQTLVANDPSIAGSNYGDDLEGPLLDAERDPHNFEVLLHRRHSTNTSPLLNKPRNEAWWPRCMSFSDVEDAVLSWEPVGTLHDDGDNSDTWTALQKQKYIAEDFKTLYDKVSDLQDRLGPWVERKVDSVDALDDQAAQDQEGFQSLYYQLSESYEAIKQNSKDILADERSHVMEMIKDIDVLGAKLEYEINALVSKVQDVEDGVAQFERQVDDLESRADELEAHLNTESWPHWLVRSVTGIGSRPTRKMPLGH
ncbi:stb2 [Hyphodiscus hymeniophilus]|uniref:Stb2 n=1 Tax=Hyphodiscus hymeniophilus TaxID=353542 RepID=A0A9P7B041_9HELO|nr:stb2 [Hyphodiscus hymeniophilus]